MHRIISISYERSDSIEMQAKRSEIAAWERKGYHIVRESYGFYVLNRPARVMITFDDGQTMNFKKQILEFYGKSRVSEGLVETFRKEVASGKVRVVDGPNGRVIITPQLKPLF